MTYPAPTVARPAGMNDSATDPRIRVASNLWIDRARRHGVQPSNAPSEQAEPKHYWSRPTAASDRATREAAGTLLVNLSPQERTAVVLKDAFDLALESVRSLDR